MAAQLAGVISPNLTPFNQDLSVAKDLYLSHALWLLEQGLAGRNPFWNYG